jgi:hypothetical protein
MRTLIGRLNNSTIVRASLSLICSEWDAKCVIVLSQVRRSLSRIPRASVLCPTPNKLGRLRPAYQVQMQIWTLIT